MNDAAPSDFFDGVEFFSAFSAEERAQIAAQGKSLSFEFGDTICNAGEPSEGLYVIKKGAVRLFTEEQGKEVSMGVRKEREVFGEISVLKRYKHEASVRASAKTELLYFPHEVFQPILTRNVDANGYVANYVAINTAGGVDRYIVGHIAIGVDIARQDGLEYLVGKVEQFGLSRCPHRGLVFVAFEYRDLAEDLPLLAYPHADLFALLLREQAHRALLDHIEPFAGLPGVADGIAELKAQRLALCCDLRPFFRREGGKELHAVEKVAGGGVVQRSVPRLILITITAVRYRVPWPG